MDILRADGAMAAYCLRKAAIRVQMSFSFFEERKSSSKERTRMKRTSEKKNKKL